MIDTQRIDMIIQEGEGLAVEFKEHFSPPHRRRCDCLREYERGHYYPRCKGWQDRRRRRADERLEGRINFLGRNCSPPIQTKIRQMKNIVVIDVPQGDEKPYGCGAGYFRRLDGTTQKMSNHELRVMFREHEPISFEEMIHREVPDYVERLNTFVYSHADSVVQLARPNYSGVSKDAKQLMDLSKKEPDKVFNTLTVFIVIQCCYYTRYESLACRG